MAAFFTSWALWEQMTFVLGAAIFLVFLAGLMKLFIITQAARRHERIDLEKRARAEELYRAGMRPRPVIAEVPFGIRAIELGVEVEGIWISGPSFPNCSASHATTGLAHVGSDPPGTSKHVGKPTGKGKARLEDEAEGFESKVAATAKCKRSQSSRRRSIGSIQHTKDQPEPWRPTYSETLRSLQGPDAAPLQSLISLRPSATPSLPVNLARDQAEIEHEIPPEFRHLLQGRASTGTKLFSSAHYVSQIRDFNGVRAYSPSPPPVPPPPPRSYLRKQTPCSPLEGPWHYVPSSSTSRARTSTPGPPAGLARGASLTAGHYVPTPSPAETPSQPVNRDGSTGRSKAGS